MVKKLKKGQKGAQANFISRSKAIRKLQLKLSDFRRLCILKGVYPREPKKHPKGKDKVYYHIKDIRFLAHEKLLDKFRELKAFSKKIKKALGRQDQSKLDQLKQNRPTYNLNHLVKERYPSFVDALRDLDDPLCLLSLYTVFPSHKMYGIEQTVIGRCQRLMREFNLYIIKSQSLRKVFLSIKGVYYQAEIQGQTVNWIVPYQFTQKLPAEVDYKIMGTFLEFYCTLIKFLNYKLYSQLGFNYPPKIDLEQETVVYNSYKTMLLENKSMNQMEQEQNDKFKIDEQFKSNSEVQQIMGTSEFKAKDLFKGFVFWLNREVPRYILELIILAFGGQVYWDNDGSEVEIDSEIITHVIIDRPKEHIQMLANKEYLQPQWVLDSVNNEILVPIKDYGPGVTLPPHLSPFVDNQKEGYLPERQKQLDQFKDGVKEIVVEDDEDYEQQQLDSEEEYVHQKEVNKKDKLQKLQEKERQEMAKSVMTKKQRSILKKIDYGKDQKKQEASKLKQKAKKVKK